MSKISPPAKYQSYPTKCQKTNLDIISSDSVIPTKEISSKVSVSIRNKHIFACSIIKLSELQLINTNSIFLVFIFTMPGYNCSIKDRMLYASAKNAVVETIEHFGVVIDKKVSWIKSNTYLWIYCKPFDYSVRFVNLFLFPTQFR